MTAAPDSARAGSRARPAFIVTVDAEGDDAWSRPRTTRTRNAAYLPRFQALCEAHGLKVTWLAEHAMAQSPAFRELGRGALARGTGEIGMHLHAWEAPPLAPLTADDRRWQPYLAEYPEPVMREKIERHTAALEDAFGVPVVSHRGGRFSLDERYARMLAERGYLADCSVTPHVSWRGAPGAPGGRGGPDYTGFPETPYWLDPGDIARAGASPLLEVPVTIASQWPRWLGRALGAFGSGRRNLPRRAVNRVFPALAWMYPGPRNGGPWLPRIVRRAAREGRPHVEFMLHSSELMPGGSPWFGDEAAVEALYARLETLFAAAARHCRPMTLSEFRGEWARACTPPGGNAAGAGRRADGAGAAP